MKMQEGKPDLRNNYSRIWHEGWDPLILLPSNAAFIGISDEDGLLIMQSYQYYNQGGRYNRIEAYGLQDTFSVAGYPGQILPLVDELSDELLTVAKDEMKKKDE